MATNGNQDSRVVQSEPWEGCSALIMTLWSRRSLTRPSYPGE